MKQWMVLSFLGILSLTACAASGKDFPISLSFTEGVSASPAGASPQKVVIFPLEDRRLISEAPAERIGRRTHLFGRIDTFESKIPVGESVAQLVATTFRLRGWEVHPAPPGSRPDQITDARVVTGSIQTLWAEAVSHIGYTEIDTHFSLHLEIRDPKTGATTRFKIDDENDPKVVFFNPQKLERTVNDLVSEGISRIVS